MKCFPTVSTWLAAISASAVVLVSSPLPAADAWSDARLVQFLDELVAYVDAHHVVRDPAAVTYGMNYEFYDPETDRKVQAFGLDTMHDGAWFASSLLVADRACPERGYLDRVLKYEVPFYVNLLNHSDALFPEKVERQDKKEIVEPLKGWAPRGWDEGIGYDFATGKRFGRIEWSSPKADEVVTRRKDGEFWYSYYTPSNHLSQDLADLMLNAWLSTRSSEVASAARHLREYKLEYFGPIATLEHAAAMAAGVEPQRSFETAELDAEDGGHYYGGLYQQQEASLPVYDDNLAWQYRACVAEAVEQRRPLDPAAAWEIAARVHGAMALYEAYFASEAWPRGLYAFHRAKADIAEGKFVQPHNTRQPMLAGTRGIQLSWLGAAVLPALRARPEAWENPYREKHRSDLLIRMVDTEQAPQTDGRADEVYRKSQPFAPGNTTVRLVSGPAALHVWVQSTEPKVKLTVGAAAPAGQSLPAGLIEIGSDGKVIATNNRGDRLIYQSRFVAGSPWAAELRLPYTVSPGQARWINGVEHGRYTIAIDGGKPSGWYLLSEPERIIRRLEGLVLGTVETWHRIWKAKSYLPAAYMPGGKTPGNWDMSENGGYAHLIHTIAMLLIDRAGSSEWQRIAERSPQTPLDVSLPASVLRAQGIPQSR